MFGPTYQQLINRGFKSVRLINKNGEYPNYMGAEINDILIIAQHLINNEYAIHCAVNRFGRFYDSVELETHEKFEDIDSLEELIKTLTEDIEPHFRESSNQPYI